jgi:hypothetical protein
MDPSALRHSAAQGAPKGAGRERRLERRGRSGGPCRPVAAEPGAGVESPALQAGVQEPNPRAASHAALSDYRALYGASTERPRDANGRVWFQLDRGTRLGLEQTTGAARIAHYAIRVAPFDRDALLSRLREMGTRVLPAPDEPDVLRFADGNGIVVELRVASS